MNVGILTFHNAHNYGAVLQAYALRTKLRKMGHEAHIINYRNESVENVYPKKLKLYRNYIGRRDIVFPWRWNELFGKLAVRRQMREAWKRRHDGFNDFINTVLLEGKLDKVTINDLVNMDIDFFICGSDQIWTSNLSGGLDPVYFLDFKTQAKKISYAASRKTEDIPAKEQSYFIRCLAELDCISVREKNLSKTLSLLCKKQIDVTVDPTLLLNSDEYNQISSEPNEKEKYVFMYALQADKILRECAQHAANRLGVKLIELYTRLPAGHGKRNCLADISPSEFLSYYKNAEYIFSHSFHGTIFAIIFQKNFYSVYEKDSRKDNLLDILELQSRHIYSIAEVDVDASVDYVSVNRLIDSYREYSINFLSSALKNS